jgi:ketosteroid isomerase-like protein
MDDRIEAAREVLRASDMGSGWDAAVEDGMPPGLAALQRELVEAYRRADVEWLLEHTHPDVAIHQLAELPDSKSYHGHEGFIDALLDWPSQWQDFRIEPLRVFAIGDDHLVIVSIHHGRPPSINIEVAAEIVLLMRFLDRRMTNWDFYLTAEEAVAAAQAR